MRRSIFPLFALTLALSLPALNSCGNPPGDHNEWHAAGLADARLTSTGNVLVSSVKLRCLDPELQTLWELTPPTGLESSKVFPGPNGRVALIREHGSNLRGISAARTASDIPHPELRSWDIGVLAEDGSLIWQRQVVNDSPRNDYTNEPLLAPDGSLYFSWIDYHGADPETSYLLCFDAAGQERWRIRRGEISGLALSPGGRLCFAEVVHDEQDPEPYSLHFRLTALSPADGREAWSLDGGTDLFNVLGTGNSAAPLLVSYQGNLQARSEEGLLLWSQPIPGASDGAQEIQVALDSRAQLWVIRRRGALLQRFSTGGDLLGEYRSAQPLLELLGKRRRGGMAVRLLVNNAQYAYYPKGGKVAFFTSEGDPDGLINFDLPRGTAVRRVLANAEDHVFVDLFESGGNFAPEVSYHLDRMDAGGKRLQRFTSPDRVLVFISNPLDDTDLL